MTLKNRAAVTPLAYRVSLGRVRPGKFPEALDHFEITDRSAASDYTYKRDEEIHAALVAMGYGDKPTRVPIRMFSGNLLSMLRQSYRYATPEGRVLCEGDGETANRAGRTGVALVPCNYGRKFPERNPKDLLTILEQPGLDNPNAGMRCAFAQNRNQKLPSCRPFNHFEFLLDIPSIPRCFGAVARFVSKGEKTTDELFASLSSVEASLAQAQLPTGVPVPLDLMMQMRAMKYWEGGAQKSTRKPVVFVVPRFTEDELMLVATQRSAKALELAAQVRLLAAARNVEPDPTAEAEFSMLPSLPESTPMKSPDSAELETGKF